MKRNEFIKTIGLGTIAACAICLGACSKDDETTTPAPVIPSDGLKFDLNDSANAALRNVGGSVVKNGIIVVHQSQDQYIALSVACTHQGTPVNYQQGNMQFVCPNHGSRFSTDGAVLQGPANSGLRKYTVIRDMQVLTVK